MATQLNRRAGDESTERRRQRAVEALGLGVPVRQRRDERFERITSIDAQAAPRSAIAADSRSFVAWSTPHEMSVATPFCAACAALPAVRSRTRSLCAPRAAPSAWSRLTTTLVARPASVPPIGDIRAGFSEGQPLVRRPALDCPAIG